MSLLKKLGFGKKEDACVVSPFAGEIVPLEEVKDETFASKVLGDGVAVIPGEDTVCSPVDGTVEMVFDTAHAIAFRTEDGAEILMHIGLDTVELNGKYFHIQAQSGQSVKKGDVLGTVEFDEIKKAGYDVVTPIFLTNMDEYAFEKAAEKGACAKGDVLFRMKRK